MPYYLIHDTVTSADDRLVKAKNAASALNHAVSTRMTIRAVGIDELADMLTRDDMPLEVATKDAETVDAKESA